MNASGPYEPLSTAGQLLESSAVLVAVLELAVQRATWPDGSPLVDVDATVLRERLLPHLVAAMSEVAAARPFDCSTERDATAAGDSERTVNNARTGRRRA